MKMVASIDGVPGYSTECIRAVNLEGKGMAAKDQVLICGLVVDCKRTRGNNFRCFCLLFSL